MATTRNMSLYKRNDARRLAQTLVKQRRQSGETIPLPATGTHSLDRLPANVLAQYASRPASEGEQHADR